ncbi:hypothetical protein ACFL3S_02425 [Gemmatimonadota bacterium]
MRKLTILVLLMMSASGCRSGETEANRVTQRDSAGIVIVENPSQMALDAGGWGIEKEPFLSIGSVDGDEDTSLFRVERGHRLADGGIAIVNGGAHEIRVFDGSGSLVSTFGREGDGPEEFRDIRLAGVVGRDTLVLVDVSRKRLALIHPEEGFLQGAPVADEVSSFPVPSGTFADGRVVFAVSGRIEWSEDFVEGPARPLQEYRTSDLQGAFTGSLGSKPGSEVVLSTMIYNGEPMVRRASGPLGKFPRSAVSSDRFYFGSEDTFEIEAVDPEGRIRRLIRVMEDPHPVTAEAYALFVEEEIGSRYLDEDAERRVREVYREREETLPPTFPAHGLLETDALDHLWVEEYRLPGQETLVWSVFDPQGIRLARVSLPRPMVIMEIGQDYLMGLVRDDLDVEYVQLFRLYRGEAQTVDR